MIQRLKAKLTLKLRVSGPEHLFVSWIFCNDLIIGFRNTHSSQQPAVMEWDKLKVNHLELDVVIAMAAREASAMVT